jgi:hypothetical protein
MKAKSSKSGGGVTSLAMKQMGRNLARAENQKKSPKKAGKGN